MENKEFGKKLTERTIEFALSIISISAKLPDTEEGRIIRKQITKSGTSIGANYAEANRAKSEPDFSNKIKICEGEANETVYWLTIIDRLNWIDSILCNSALNEANQLLYINQ
jgi:four helix bundle protein